MRNGKSIARGEGLLTLRKSCAVMVAFFVCCFGAVITVLAEDVTGLKPISVRVVDSQTLLPVTNFSYSCWIDTPTSPRALQGENVPVASPDGRFEIAAPASCKITIAAMAPDFVSGYNNYKNFDLRSDDLKREIEVRLRRGFLLRGTVRDNRTKLPVAGASVAPLTFTPPLWMPDEKRVVRTDEQGRFEIRGVDEFGVEISQSNYAKASLSFHENAIAGARPGGSITREILLETGNIVKGRVTSPAGKPLENAKVVDYGGKVALTGKDGLPPSA